MSDKARPDAPTPPPEPAGEELRDPRRQAASFEETRRAHQTELVEDYAELIADLIDATGEARTVDLARRLGVTHATVTKMLSRMQREGLIVSRPYRSIFLTEDGRGLAAQARRRHQVVVDFLKALGVDEETAEVDAEGIEHHVSETTLAAFERLLEERRDDVAAPADFDPIAERERVLRLLRQREAGLRARGIRRLALIGSMARGDSGPASDVDVLVDLDPDGGFTLFDLVDLKDELGAALGRSVDVAFQSKLHPRVKDEILAESRDVFA